MSYEVKESKAYARPAAELLAAAGELVTQLGGKPVKKAAAGQVMVDFNKEIGGKAFGNRVQLVVRVTDDSPGRARIAIEAYPIDPIGQRLRFGVVGEPARLVSGAFWARLETRLGPEASEAPGPR